jgi:XTP/dITP diphosphohydrolase
MDLWVATTNAGKLAEIKNFFIGTQVHVRSVNELNYYTSPKETGKTFEENARIKARALRAVKNQDWVIGEDSGLEVEGLNNMPGVYSARYAGENARDNENTAKLLKMMSLRSATHRKAQFRCCMIVFDPSGNEIIINGLLKGEISKAQRGTLGFGYDPIFIPEGHTKTLAEMQPGEKNLISHRAQALKEFKQRFL